MTQFSSKPPFNDDPAPWVVRGGIGRASEDIHGNPAYAKFHTSRDPRPEYDRPQHNPTNPILTEFRNLHAETGNNLWTDAYLSASDLIEEWDEHDTEHWSHAMDVFTRILRMSK